MPCGRASGPSTRPTAAVRLSSHDHVFAQTGTETWTDHRALAAGGWQNKSPGPAGQAPRLVIEWTADLSRPIPAHLPDQADVAGRDAPPCLRGRHSAWLRR